MKDTLTAWYSERPAAPTTGNAAADAALVKLAALRDGACACKDLACAHAAKTKVHAEAKPLASDVPTAARDASGKMLDEVTRCRQKLTYGPPTPQLIPLRRCVPSPISLLAPPTCAACSPISTTR